jgi:hypothetical protein
MISFHGFGQRHLFSEVSIDRSKVYVGEPVEVSVGIYTSTWFTKGVNFGNIKVNGAFTVYFRSVSSSKQINGKNYAGVVAIYNVFPYDNKDLIFPSLEFTVETPNEGDSKGVKRVVKTKARNISVKAVPNNYDQDEWLVSSSVSVNESWQGDLKNVKIGNVIQRTIYRKAFGTVSELIPPIKWDSVQGVSMYPTRAEINSEKSKTSISASRSDGVRYLFEKEGTVTLPEITVTWWNPRQNKLFKRTLKEKTIQVLANPDLGMLESVKDSLALYNQVLSEETFVEEELNILGLSLKDFLTYLGIILGSLLLIYKFLKWLLITKGLLKKWRHQREAYSNSEKYYFKLFLTEATKKNSNASLNAMYNWIDRLGLKEPTLHYLAKNYGNQAFISTLDKWERKSEVYPLPEIHHIKKARKNFLKSMSQKSNQTSVNWINP